MRLKNIGKFQEGGAMPPQDPAAQPGGGDPMQEILMGCQQAVETQDCQIALQVCQVMLEMAGGGAAPAEAAPAPESRNNPHKPWSPYPSAHGAHRDSQTWRNSSFPWSSVSPEDW